MPPRSQPRPNPSPPEPPPSGGSVPSDDTSRALLPQKGSSMRFQAMSHRASILALVATLVGLLLSPDALASLALLLSRPVLEAGEYVEIPRSGELMRVIEDFFRMHFQRFQGLRSLEVLRSLEPPAERVAEKPRDGGAARTDSPGEERHPHG